MNHPPQRPTRSTLESLSYIFFGLTSWALMIFAGYYGFQALRHNEHYGTLTFGFFVALVLTNTIASESAP